MYKLIFKWGNLYNYIIYLIQDYEYVYESNSECMYEYKWEYNYEYTFYVDSASE